jgi:hypothetical protein
MDVEVFQHPVIILAGEWSERVQVLAAQDVDQEPGGLIEIGHGEPDVIESPQTRQTVLRHRSPPSDRPSIASVMDPETD